MCVCTLRDSEITDTPIAVRLPSAHILVSNMILHLKEPGIVVEMVDSRTGKGKVKMVLEHDAPESKEC